MRVLRTPETRFENLPGYSFAPHYFETCGLRIHYLDEGRGETTFLCLHGEPTWSYLYRKMIPVLSERGRVIAPDPAGFGKSDKPAETKDYTFDFHFAVLSALLEHTQARNIVLICQDWGGLLGLPLAMEFEQRFSGLVIMNTGIPDPTTIDWLRPMNIVGSIGFIAWRTFAVMQPDLPVGHIVSAGCWPPLTLATEVRAAYEAPFPDKIYKAGAEAFPRLVPLSADHPTLPHMQLARARIARSTLPKLVMFSNRDPITWSQHAYFSGLTNVVGDITVENAGHFLQEDKGEEIAREIVRFF